MIRMRLLHSASKKNSGLKKSWKTLAPIVMAILCAQNTTSSALRTSRNLTWTCAPSKIIESSKSESWQSKWVQPLMIWAEETQFGLKFPLLLEQPMRSLSGIANCMRRIRWRVVRTALWVAWDSTLWVTPMQHSVSMTNLKLSPPVTRPLKEINFRASTKLQVASISHRLCNALIGVQILLNPSRMP